MVLYKIDRILANIQDRIPYALLNPTNIKLEENKVIKNPEYNPQLQYKPLAKDLRVLQAQLQKLHIPKTPLGRLFHEKRVELYQQIDMILDVGLKAFTSHSIAVYGAPSRTLVHRAQQYLHTKEQNNHEYPLGKITIVKKFLDACVKHKFTCDILEKEMITKASINPQKKKLYFNSDGIFTESDLRRLTTHEIGTHLRRAEHARQQKLQLFSIGFQGYLATEEGLAVYNEEQNGLLSAKVLKHYAARVIAVDLALHNSFHVVYRTLQDYFPSHEAFNLAIRAKRGLSDTVMVGGYTKDYLYLQGWYDVKHYLRQGGNLKDLYIGKIGVQHVPSLSLIAQELKN